MTRMFLIMLLMLTSTPVYAEWVSVVVIDLSGATLYMDPATMNRKGDRMKMWELIDYEVMQTMAGIPYLSASLQREYDCSGQLQRTLAVMRWSGHMGTGEEILTNLDDPRWEAVDPGSIGQRLWRVACSKK